MVRGDLSAALASMGRLEDAIDELIRLPRKLAVEVAPRLSRLLQREFSQGTNPYGRRWAKLATGRASHLTQTGRLRAGTRATPSPGGRAGVRVVVGAPYGAFHQTGTARMPARKILPDRGMPAAWRAAFETSARALARKAKARLR